MGRSIPVLALMLALAAGLPLVPPAVGQGPGPDGARPLLEVELDRSVVEARWGTELVLQVTVHNRGAVDQMVALDHMEPYSSSTSVVFDQPHLPVPAGGSATTSAAMEMYGGRAVGWPALERIWIRATLSGEPALVATAPLDVALFSAGNVLSGQANATIAPGERGTLRLFASALPNGSSYTVSVDGAGAQWVRLAGEVPYERPGDPDRVLLLDVDVPESTPLGTYPIVVRATSSATGYSAARAGNLTVASESRPAPEPSATMDLRAGPTRFNASGGDSVAIVVTLTTSEAMPASWHVRSIPADWTYAWSKPTGVMMAAGVPYSNALTVQFPDAGTGARQTGTIEVFTRSLLGEVQSSATIQVGDAPPREETTALPVPVPTVTWQPHADPPPPSPTQEVKADDGKADPPVFDLPPDGSAPAPEVTAEPTPTSVPVVAVVAAAGVGTVAVGSLAAHRKWPFAFAALYARIAPARVLEHPVRRRVMDEIVREPGISVSELQRRVGLTNGGVAHHVQTLERSRHVASVADGHVRRLYPAGEHRPTPQGTIPERLLRALAAKGELTLSEAAREIGVSRQSLHYHVRRMIAEQRLDARRDGTQTRLRIRVPR